MVPLRMLLMALLVAPALAGCARVDESGETKPPPAPEGFVFDFVEDFDGGMAAVLVDGRWGFMDNTGVLRVEPRFAEARSLTDGMALVALAQRPAARQEGLSADKPPLKWGYVDRSGRVVVEPKFDRAGDFYDGLAVVSETGGPEPNWPRVDADNTSGAAYYLIDRTGRRLHAQTFNYISEVRHDFCVVQLRNRYGFIRRDGTLIVPPQYDDVNSFDNGLAVVTLNGKSGLIDATGKVVVPLAFDYISTPFTIDFSSRAAERAFPAGRCFHEGRALVRVGEKWGCIDRSSKVIIEPRYDRCGDFTEGLASVELNGKCGFVDYSGRVVIEPQFETAGDFDNGLARAGLNGKIGLIDRTGRFVIAPRWVGIENLENGTAVVFVDATYQTTKWPPRKVRQGLIDRADHVLVEPRFNEVQRFGPDRALVLVDAAWNDKGYRNGGKWGVIDFNGKFVVPPQYDGVGETTPSWAWVYNGTYDNDGFLRNDRWRRIDRDGNIIEKGPDGISWLHTDYSEGLAPEHDGKYNYGYVDRNGRFVIAPRFEDARDFQEGFAAVSVLASQGENVGPMYGFIDRKGNVLKVTRP